MGISLGVLIVILIIWLVFRKKEKKKYEEEETPNEIRFKHPLFFYDWLIFCAIILVKMLTKIVWMCGIVSADSHACVFFHLP